MLTTPLIQAVNKALPNVELTVAEAFSGYLSGWLERGEIDLGFVFNRSSSETIVIEPFAEEELYLITDAKTALRLPSNVSIEDLGKLQLIAPSKRHGLRTDIEELAFRHGVKLNIKLEIDAGHQLIRQVLRGAGSAVLARSAVMQELQDGDLKAIKNSNPVFKRTVCLAIKCEKMDSYLLVQVKQILESVFEELVANGSWPCQNVRGTNPHLAQSI